MLSRPATVLLASLLLLGASLPTVAAQEPEEENDTEDETGDEAEEADREDEDRDEPDEVERKVEIETDEEGVSIELERERGESEDVVEMGFEYEDAAFELSYENETEAGSVEAKLEAQFSSLAEYRDGNDNGRYDAGEPVVSAYALGEDSEEDDESLPENGTADWGDATVSDVTRDGKQGKRIDAPAAIGDNGTFELTFLVFGDFVDLESGPLTPTGAKIDVGIHDYPYRANGTDLALFVETETESEAEIDDDHEAVGDDERGVAASNRLGNLTVDLVFTWKDTARVDGADEPVGTTELSFESENETEAGETERETERAFALSYARGDDVVHDPKALVATAAADTADVPGWSAPAALFGLAVVALVARRRG